MPTDHDDGIILSAKKAVLSGRTSGPEIQAMMELVADVIGYKMDSATNQGWLHRKLIRHRIETNHIIDTDVLISNFWTGVIKALYRVEVAGANVPVWYDEMAEVDGQPHVRATRMSSLNYLRQHGLFMAKMYINTTFKRRLRQQCLDCKTISPIGSTREYDNGCPKCKSMDSRLNQVGPHGRTRTCNQCKNVRPTHFERVCGKPKLVNGNIQFVEGCGSENITLITLEEYSTATINNETIMTVAVDSVVEHDTPESLYADFEVSKDIIQFIKECEQGLPPDPHDPRGDSRNRQILRLLVLPESGRDICRKCKEQAGYICSKQCGKTDCDHPRVFNYKDCCGADHFSLPSCINYNRKIATYLGCASNLINMRIKKIRRHTLSFAIRNAHRFTVASYIASRLTTGPNVDAMSLYE